MALAGPGGCWVPTLDVVVDAALFDFGGVITSSPFDASATYAPEAGLPARTVRLRTAHHPHAHHPDTHQLSSQKPSNYLSKTCFFEKKS